MKHKPLITIIGKPNVGKSTLFNRIIGEKKSIVSPIEGVTRDRVYGSYEWLGKYYDIIDTGGFMLDEDDVMNKNIKIQLDIAKEESDFIIFLVDGKASITSNDQELAKHIRILEKPYQLVINKVDKQKDDLDNFDYYDLGLEDPIFISAEHGRNIGNLLDKIESFFPNAMDPHIDDNIINFAISGMPNVGKSSIVNCLTKKEKSIVTDIAGTTRDSVDSYINYYKDEFRLIDTAGIRKRSKLLDEIEYYSTVRSFRAINESDVSAVVVDVSKGFDKQDRNIINYVIDKGKGLIIVLNKWDLIEKDTQTMKNFTDEIEYQFKSLSHYPILYISALTKQRVSKVLKIANKVFKSRKLTIKTSLLNKFLQKSVKKQSPPATHGKVINLNYMTQVSAAPHLFVIYTNYPKLITASYKRFIENQLREEFDLLGIPIRISFRKK